MIKTRPNVGFTLQYSLRWSNGIEIDLRKQTGIKFDLILPDDTSVRITGLGYDSFQNKVWVRVPAAHTTAEGVYRASLSVMTKDLQLISTGIHDIAEIDENATSGYQSITLRMDVVSVDTPVNMGQGYSPKIVNGEWYVFDDSQQSYVPTGVAIVSQASIDSAVNAEKALREAADTSLETAIAAEATRATGKEQELDAKINAKTSNIAISQLSESTKQYIEASGGGTITNMPDEEDLTVENNALKLKERKESTDCLAYNRFNGNNAVPKSVMSLKKDISCLEAQNIPLVVSEGGRVDFSEANLLQKLVKNTFHNDIRFTQWLTPTEISDLVISGATIAKKQDDTAVGLDAFNPLSYISLFNYKEFRHSVTPRTNPIKFVRYRDNALLPVSFIKRQIDGIEVECAYIAEKIFTLRLSSYQNKLYNFKVIGEGFECNSKCLKSDLTYAYGSWRGDGVNNTLDLSAVDYEKVAFVVHKTSQETITQQEDFKLVVDGVEYSPIFASSSFDYIERNPINPAVVKAGIPYGYKLQGNTLGTEVHLNVTNLPTAMSAYNLSPSNSADVNSQNLTRIIDYIKSLEGVQKVHLQIGYVSDDPISLYSKVLDFGNRHVDFHFEVNNNLFFDRSVDTIPTIEELEASTEHLWIIHRAISIIARNILISGNAVIDGGAKVNGQCAFPGHYYEGVYGAVAGLNYPSSFDDSVLFAVADNTLRIEGLTFKNTFIGVGAYAVSGAVSDCEFSDVYGDNGLTVMFEKSKLNVVRGYVVERCVFKNVADVGVSVQCPYTTVIDCQAVGCGNHADPTASDFGVDSSFNCGGGFATELHLSNFGTNNDNHVQFINCSVIDCYNYGFSGFGSGIKYVNCSVYNLIHHYKDEWDSLSGLRYRNMVNKKHGAAFLATSVQYPPFAEGCRISGVNRVCWRPFKLQNSVVEGIYADEYDSHANEDSSTLVNCELDSSCSLLSGTSVRYQNALTQGTTANRPTNVVSGFQYYDTDLGKPIWWSGTDWVDATGTTI